MRHIVTRETFITEFIKNFAPFVPLKKLKKLHCYPPNGYLWMICEHNLVVNFKGNEAKAMYDQIDKTDAIEFQYDNGFLGDDTSSPLSEENDNSEKISKSRLIEFYVIGKDFSWCYIVTHEPDGCGPYFIINNDVGQ